MLSLPGSREFRLLLRRRFLLKLRLPFLIGHAVDDLPRFGVGQRQAFVFGGGAVPFAQAIPAETRQIHHIYVLDIVARAQMLDQPAEGGGSDAKKDEKVVDAEYTEVNDKK